MNFTSNYSISAISNCSLPNRVYTPSYLFFKLLNATYLRVIIGPGILLNTLCLIVLSRPRLSNKSTTIVFLRFLAFFDIMAIILKYIRAEINYQSTEKGHQIFLLIPPVCKTLYVLMNASISIAMWIIVLMSLDKVVAVSYPLKSSIWLTHRRACYVCWLTIILLLLANASFFEFSGVGLSRHNRKYCRLNEASFIIDLLTASILPMGLITAANIIIAVVLHRVSRVSLNWQTSEDSVQRESNTNFSKTQHLSTPSICYRSSSTSTVITTDIVLAAKRRTSAQVTRMLLAVTLSLIICNIPNTMLFIFFKLYDTRQLLHGRLCTDVSDADINLYKFGFYSSVIQDILSDLPHIFNFFLYCLAGKKFRSIFLNEARHYLLELHLIKRKERRFTDGTFILKREMTPSNSANAYRGSSPSPNIPLSKARQSVEVLCNGKTSTTVLNSRNKNFSRKSNPRYNPDQKSTRSYTTIQ